MQLVSDTVVVYHAIARPYIYENSAVYFFNSSGRGGGGAGGGDRGKRGRSGYCFARYEK